LQARWRRHLEHGRAARHKPDRLLGFLITRIGRGYDQLPIGLPERQYAVAARGSLGHEFQGMAFGCRETCDWQLEMLGHM